MRERQGGITESVPQRGNDWSDGVRGREAGIASILSILHYQEH